MTTGTAPPSAAVAAHQRRTVRRSGYALVSSSVLSSIAGVAYWWVAARAWPGARVGEAAALISSMALVAEIASLGMATGLVRHLPIAGGSARSLVLRTYATALALALVLGVVGLLVLERIVDDLPHGRALGVWFVVGTCVWVLFVIQDGALVGLGRATVVPVENALFGIGRVGLVLVVAAVSTTTMSLYLTWIVPSALGVVAVTALVLVRYAPRHDADGRDLYRATVRFSAVNHLAAMLQRVWPMAMPVTVLSVLGAEAGSHAFIAWSSAYTIWLISRGTGQALLAEGSRTPALLHRLTGTALVQTMRLTVLGTAATLVLGPWYLALFGRGYAEGGTTLLRLLAIASIPNAVTELYLSTKRARSSLGSVVSVQAALGLPTLVLAVPVLRWQGLTGLGVLWLANQLVVAAVVLVHGRWSLWIPSLTPGTVDALARIGRLPGRTRSATTSPRGTAAVVTHDGVLGGVVTERADDPAAVGRLRREAAHLRAVRADGALLALRPLVPEVVALDTDDERGVLVLTSMAGVRADPRDPAALEQIAELAATMHRATSRSIEVGGDHVRRWVGDRVDVLTEAVRTAAPRHVESLVRFGEELAAGLPGTVQTIGTVHGDLSPANVLVDGPSGRITGLVDWELAGFGEPTTVDLVQLLLAFPVARGEGELGQLVAETLAFGWSDDDRALLHRHATPGGAAPDDPLFIQLAWLRHAWANLVKRPRYASNRVWVVRNLLPVLDLARDRR